MQSRIRGGKDTPALLPAKSLQGTAEEAVMKDQRTSTHHLTSAGQNVNDTDADVGGADDDLDDEL